MIKHLSRATTSLMAIAASIAIWTMACSEVDEFFPPAPDPSLTGTWSATFGQVTLRYNLRDDGGTITGDFSLVAPGSLEGNGQVTGTLSGVQVRLDTPYTVVPLPYDVEIETAGSFTGRKAGNRIDGEISLEGYEAPVGTDPETGRPIGVRVNALTAPITLVRTVP
ncbi:MAG: hypothetical protein OXE73_17500 [Gammaproteobacteria bacterium]|nr:hypothetical protein [Gammaproteobacteria bacterium]